LENAPEWVANWTGQRMDRQGPLLAGDEYIAWLSGMDRDPREKLLIASDALDVGPDFWGFMLLWRDAFAMGRLQRIFSGRATLPMRANGFPSGVFASVGVGHFLTNDFRDCNPLGDTGFDPLSLVCN